MIDCFFNRCEIHDTQYPTGSECPKCSVGKQNIDFILKGSADRGALIKRINEGEKTIKELKKQNLHLQNLLNYCSQRAKKNTFRGQGHFCQYRTNCEAIVNIVKDCYHNNCNIKKSKENIMKTTTIQVYQDKAKEWRWRLIHANGNILANSSEGYANKGDILEIIENIRTYMETAHIEVK